MPDPERKSVSASQIGALFNVSPWQTRWMLWQRFAHGLADDTPETSRMRWGKLLEPLVLRDAAREMKFEVTPNESQVYYRRGLVGATRDATITIPDKGPGAVEVKCIFDYPTWMSEWDGGRRVPRHYELQLQTQMYVGDGTGGRPFEWGLIVAWVCAGADLYFYERAPILPLWHEIERECFRFFKSIENREEPDPFGDPIEIPMLTSMFETNKAEVLDLSTSHPHVRTAEDLRMYAEAKNQKTFYDNVYSEYRAKFLALAKDAGEVKLPCGYGFRVQRSGKGKSVIPFVPDVPLDPPAPPEPILAGG